MRKLIMIIIFLVFIFIINVMFYFISDDYRFFLKKIKNPEEVVYIEEKKIDDKIEKEILDGAGLVDSNKNNNQIFDIDSNSEKIKLKKEITLGKNYRKIKNLFLIYKLKELEINTNLFDITDEYPDNYFEYYGKDLTLYLFPTKTYTDLYDIFNVLQQELPFNINKVDNFGDNSFYINLNKDITDRFIRVVIGYNGIVFGLKIKKSEYLLVKEKLNTLKINNN